MIAEKTKYWVAFASIDKVGAAFIRRVYEYCDFDIERAWKISENEIRQIPEIQKSQAEIFFKERKIIIPDEKLELIIKNDMKVLVYSDNDYPLLLKNITSPPMVLFYRGNLECCNFDKTLGVVGSRSISHGAVENIKKIVGGFEGSDLTIVSGGAIGADTAAHESALENGLSTIAVLGSGLSNLYPTRNKKLFERIIDNNGVVMSEFMPYDPPIAWHFPVRNRIISGLSKGVLIAEAALKSGALITANIALEENREVMCIPGAISNPNTQGIYKLIKQGSPIVTNSEDILEVMGWKMELNTDSQKDKQVELSGIKKEIFEIISKDSLTIDEIFITLSKRGINFSDLMINLTEMEISGLIQPTEGSRYIIK